MDHNKVNKSEIYFSPVKRDELDKLISYLENLHPESRKRFGPHPFNRESILQLLDDQANFHLFSGKTGTDDSIVAYSILKKGWLDYEIQRLSSYGLSAEAHDYTIAPSVADVWQGKGVGSRFLGYLIGFMKTNFQARRMILWGGVQFENTRAIQLYQKLGFRTLGRFEYQGLNLDMILEI